MKRTSKRSSESGVEIVEFAVVLPLLLFLALAVSEGAGMIRAHQVVNNAAREGVRIAVLPENSPSTTGVVGGLPPSVNDQVVKYIKNNGVYGTGAGQCIPQVDGQQNLVMPDGPGGTVYMTTSRVNITCPYTLKYLPHIPGFGINPTIALRGTATFRNFY